MNYDLYKCPDCGYSYNNNPDVCPTCGCDLKEYRAAVRLKMLIEEQKEEEREHAALTEEIYKEAIRLFNDGDFEDARVEFLSLGAYKESASYAEKCKEVLYKRIVEKFNDNLFLKNLVSKEEPVDYFNTPFIQKCRTTYRTSDFQSIKKILEERFVDYKQSAAYAAYCAEAFRFFKQYDAQEVDYKKYNKAVALYDGGQYEKAIAEFQKIAEVLDSGDFIIKCREAMYQRALEKLESGNYEAALEDVKKIPQVKETSYLRDLAEKYNENRYQHALKTLESGDYEAALKEFETLPQSRDASVSDDFAEKYTSEIFRHASEYYNAGKYKTALKELAKIQHKKEKAFDDLADQCYEALYQHALQTLESGDYEAALKEFETLPQSRDASVSTDFAEKYTNAIFHCASEYYHAGKYKTALKELAKIQHKQEKAFDDLADQCYEALYQRALQTLESGNYEVALQEFLKLPQSNDKAISDDFAEKYHYTIFVRAQYLGISHDYVAALEEVSKIPRLEENPIYLEFKEKCTEKIYQRSLAEAEDKNYEEALQGLRKIPGYKDASEHITRIRQDLRLTEINAEAAKKTKQRRKDRLSRVLHVPIYFLAILSCAGLGVIMLLHKEAISAVTGFWWWFAGWVVVAWLSFSCFGSYLLEALKKIDSPKFKLHKTAPKTALFMLVVNLVLAFVLIWQFGSWF